MLQLNQCNGLNVGINVIKKSNLKWGLVIIKIVGCLLLSLSSLNLFGSGGLDNNGCGSGGLSGTIAAELDAAAAITAMMRSHIITHNQQQQQITSALVIAQQQQQIIERDVLNRTTPAPHNSAAAPRRINSARVKRPTTVHQRLSVQHTASSAAKSARDKPEYKNSEILSRTICLRPASVLSGMGRGVGGVRGAMSNCK